MTIPMAGRGSTNGRKRLLLIGGLCGILSNMVFIAFAVMWANQASPPALEQTGTFLSQLGQDSLPLVILNAGWFVASFFLIFYYLALYSSLGGESSAYGTIGGIFGIISAVAFGAFTILSASAFSGLAGAYSSAAYPADKATFATAAIATSATLSGLFNVEGWFRALAIFFIGGAMFASASFGKRYGWLTIVFGVAFVAILVGAYEGISSLLIVNPFAYLAWSVITGLKLFRLSKSA